MFLRLILFVFVCAQADLSGKYFIGVNNGIELGKILMEKKRLILTLSPEINIDGNKSTSSEMLTKSYYLGSKVSYEQDLLIEKYFSLAYGVAVSYSIKKESYENEISNSYGYWHLFGSHIFVEPCLKPIDKVAFFWLLSTGLSLGMSDIDTKPHEKSSYSFDYIYPRSLSLFSSVGVRYFF